MTKLKEKKQPFEHIFHQHKNRIYYYLHYLNIPYQLHDEFYAEGMVALWQAYEQYDSSKGNLTTFLNYQIRFKLIDLIRKKEREQRAIEKMRENEQIKQTTGNRNRGKNYPLLVHANTIKIHDESLWHELREKLTERQWKWVYYFIILDLSLREIADKENVTVDAVKGWAKMTRQTLRKDPTFKKRLLAVIQT